MNSTKVVNVGSSPEFYARVSFVALRVAQKVIEDAGHENHKNRAAYAMRVFRGADNAILLAMHVLASSDGIANAMAAENSEIGDDAIEAALLKIWDARANAFAEPVTVAPMALDT